MTASPDHALFKHEFPFDPTYGYDEAAMLTIEPPTPPADFEAFWRGKFTAALDVPTRVERRPAPRLDNQHHQVFEIEFDALGLNGIRPARLGGWLVVPRKGFARAQVTGHGYGGREMPDTNPDAPPSVRLQVCLRGFHRSAQPDIPTNDSKRHVLHGIASRETYVHLGNAADIWAATKALLELYPDLADRIDYAGGSFGGGIGALATPWDPRLRRVFLEVPSFGNHPLRLTLPCTGSGEAVRQHHLTQGDVMPVMQYFDAATAARFMDKPTIVGVARFDPAVPPPGQFCVYNAIPCRKQLVVRAAGHFEYPQLPAEQRVLADAAAAWFA